MKKQEKAEIKRLSDQLHALTLKQAHLIQQGEADAITENQVACEKLAAEIERLRSVCDQKLSKEAQKLTGLPFHRTITKKEQADMGTLKKTVRGLVVVHPMTALGREMGLKEMTGYAPKSF
ncbi:YibL family ribosome-associated protein [Prodigiosinella aquatilis]|nr:YibL family ribosome-associated protein [Prodigiosinella sp. LS101]WJV54081.1 YibL family ribosome-associated protein [Prodigiosinella sp. LS101]WJV58443.1 YibL family ribosome-associated protein [Pectobacteriaceae bacterium C111]